MTRIAGYRRFKKNPWDLISNIQEKVPLEHEKCLHNLGKVIRLTRRKKKMTQEDLGELAGISPKYLGEVELGRSNPTVMFLTKIAWALEIEITDLFIGCKGEQKEVAFIYVEIISLLRRLDQSDLQKVHRVFKAMVE